jgi:two-component system NtrC family sensor kinase
VLGVLRFLDPVVPEQAFEQGIEVAVVSDAVEIMGLGHPLDHQDDQGDCERIVPKHFVGDRFGRADHRAGRAEAVGEELVEAPEQMEVLGFLAGEIEKRPDAIIVAAQLRPGEIEHEWQDEFLDQPEQPEIFVSANRVEDQPLAIVEKGGGISAGQAFRHEAPREVERGAARKNIIKRPGTALGRGKHVPEVEIVVHVYPVTGARRRRSGCGGGNERVVDRQGGQHSGERRRAAAQGDGGDEHQPKPCFPPFQSLHLASPICRTGGDGAPLGADLVSRIPRGGYSCVNCCSACRARFGPTAFLCYEAKAQSCGGGMLDVGPIQQTLSPAAKAWPDCIIMFDKRGRVIDLNGAAERLLGYSRAEAVGRPVAQLIVPDPLSDSHPLAPAALAGSSDDPITVSRLRTEIRAADGRLFPAELTLAEAADAFTASLRDLSLQASREELAAIRRRLELAVEGAKLGVWTFNPKTGDVWFSRRSRQLFGLPEEQALFDAESLRARVHPDDWERLAEPYYGGFPVEPLEIEYRVLAPDGGQRWIYALGAATRDGRGRAYEISGIHIDVTDRKLAEQELARSREALIQSERLAAMGGLLAGVSHELNNPLAAIVGQAEMLEEDSRGTPFEARARKISSAAGRCARIVGTFLAMARERETQRAPIDLNEVISSALEITDYALRTSGIAVRVIYGTHLPPVDGDRDQLHQVLVNLIVNAQQAMEKGETFEKILTIRASVSHSGHVLIDVCDTGPGIADELRGRVFEPFFTTKKQGGGTGIGLSFSQGIVEAHGGTLTVEPSRSGAHLRIHLPSVFGAGITATPAGADAPAPPPAPGRRRVLRVEDEPDVADTLRGLIEREGFDVTVAGNGAEAIVALDRDEFQFVVSDLRMPRLGGPELYARLCEVRPDLVRAMAFVTGDTIGDNMAEFLRSCDRPLLEKPFTRAGIRAVLSGLVPADRAR